MSHVNAEKTLNGMAKTAGGTMAMDMGAMKMGGMETMMHEGMGAMMKGMEPMMGEGMGAMMKGMGPMMGEGMAPMMKMPKAASGALAAGTAAGTGVVRKIVTHPVVLFGAGFIVGCYLFRHRKTILAKCGVTKSAE